MVKLGRPSSAVHLATRKVCFFLWMAVWLQCAVVSQHFIGTTCSAAAHVQRPDDFEQFNLRHSTARFHQYLTQSQSVDHRELLQVEEVKEDNEVEEVDNAKVVDEPKEVDEVAEEQVNDAKIEEEEEEEVETWVEGGRFFSKNPYLMGSVPITDWDQQRRAWLAKSAKTRAANDDDGKSRVILVTGSQPTPCRHPQGDHFHLKALKNKIDYSRMHNMEFFYNMLFLDPKLTGVWAKLPILRGLMLSNPQAEWLVWMDSDAVFTDMLFEIPFHLYDDYNMVLWTWMDGFERRDWVSVNDGVFLIRNCQWSLDLFDKWSPMGPAGRVRVEAGVFLSSWLDNRYSPFPADDQSALMYVMLTEPAVMAKIKLIEREYKLHGYWVNIVPNYEKYMAHFHPGLGDCRWPFVTHFTGCSPCTGFNNPSYPLEMCMQNFDRAFNFADNQVLAFLGFRHTDLSSVDLVRTWNESTRPLEHVGVHPWAGRIAEVAARGLPEDCYSF